MGKKKVTTQSGDQALKEKGAVDATVAKSAGTFSRRSNPGAIDAWDQFGTAGSSVPLDSPGSLVHCRR